MLLGACLMMVHPMNIALQGVVLFDATLDVVPFMFVSDCAVQRSGRFCCGDGGSKLDPATCGRGSPTPTIVSNHAMYVHTSTRTGVATVWLLQRCLVA